MKQDEIVVRIKDPVTLGFQIGLGFSCASIFFSLILIVPLVALGFLGSR